ncbi:MAG: hypothetical protein IKX61_08440 [Prevotella sp.]|nr:hypothetical protein [Prevotella sp.]
MKRASWILLLVTVLLLCACRHHSYSPRLLEADSLCSVCPDSALALLKQLSSQMPTAPEPDRMYYELLCIKAADKADRPITQSDSAILLLVDYYENGGDPAKLAETYYYAGRIFYEKQDAPQALDYYLKSMDNLNHCYDSVRIKSVLLSQIGYIYFYQGMFNESIEWYKKAIDYAVQTQDTLSLIYGYRDAASAFIENKDFNRAERFLDKSICLASCVQDKNLLYSCYNQMACVYINKGDFQKAKTLLVPALKAEIPNLRSSTYSIASKVYWGLGELDSAAYYAKKVLDIGTVYAKETASKRLSDISLKHSDLYSALEYLKTHAIYSDSVKALTNAETVAKVHALFNYNKQERENNLLKIENSRHYLIMVIAIALLVVSLLLIVSIVLYNRRKETVNKTKIDRLKKSLERQKLQNSNYISDNIIKIRELEQQMQLLDAKNEDLIRQLRIEQERLKEANQMSAFEIQNMERRSSVMSEFPIYKTVRTKANATKIYNKSLSEEEWNELDKSINDVYESFSSILTEHCIMSKHEYNVCLLLKIGLSPAEISRLTNRTQQAINSTRSRLYFKYFGKKGSASEWDDFINSI